MTSTMRFFGRRTVRRGALTVATVGAVVALTALPAAAHIVVTVPGGTVESMGNLNFQVHNESTTATAVKVSIDLPQSMPFAEVNPFHIAGWTITETVTKLPAPVKAGDFNLTKAVSNVTWTAASGAGIPPGQIQMLILNAGPFMTKGSMEFPTSVYLSDGSVVHWNQKTPAGGAEPNFPTPSLDLSTVMAADMAMPSATPSAMPSASPTASASSNSSSSTTPGLLLGGAALIVALAALIVALTSRKRPTQ